MERSGGKHKEKKNWPPGVNAISFFPGGGKKARVFSPLLGTFQASLIFVGNAERITQCDARMGLYFRGGLWSISTENLAGKNTLAYFARPVRDEGKKVL
jgi:hypothetical protein